MLFKLNRTLNNLRYCEEVNDEGGAAEAAAPEAVAEPQEGLLNAQPQEQQDWSGLQNFNSDKYKHPDQQLKAYNELHSRFGGFTGAPESYETPEGVDSENEVIQQFLGKAKDYNMNQDVVNDLLGMYNDASNIKHEVTVEGEMEKLGENAHSRITQVNQYLKNNYDQSTYAELDGMVTSAESVMLIEKMIGAQAPAVTPLDHGEATQGAITMDFINEKAYAKDEHGNLKQSIDSDYEKYVNGLWTQYVKQQNGWLNTILSL